MNHKEQHIITPGRLIKFIIGAIVIMVVVTYLTSCNKASKPIGTPTQTIEVRVQGINADSTSAGYSPVATFRG